MNLFGTKPTVSLVATDPDATEGEDPGEFTITRTGNTKLPLTVNYAMKGANNWSSPESENGKDYNPLSGVVTIPAGQSSVKIPIQTIEDTIAEWPEQVGIHLKTDNSYQIGSANSGTVKLWDNETPEVQVFAEWYSGKIGNYQRENYASESGNTGSVTFRRIGSLAKDLMVNYSLTGTAIEGTDYSYEPQSGSNIIVQSQYGGTVIRAGQHDASLILKAIDDTLVEGQETARLTLTPDANYKVWDSGVVKTVIWDNDDKPTVSIAATDNTASEYGAPGRFTITRTGSTANPLTLDYWVEPVWEPRAKNGIDYQLLADKIVIPAGASSVTIDVLPIDDSESESKELVRLLFKESSQYAISKDEGAEVTIIDNDNPTVEWKRQSGISTAGYDSCNGIAVDRTNNIYTVGRTSGNVAGTNQGLYDAWVSKYDSAGQQIWKRQLGTTGYDAASGVAVDKDSNVYAIGWTDGEGGNISDRMGWITKYDSNGNQIWKRQLPNSNYDISNGAISLSSDGSIYSTSGCYEVQ